MHTADIDPSLVKKGTVWEGLANICVTAAEKARERPPRGYTATQRNSLTDIFASMKVTHRSIRLLVVLGDELQVRQAERFVFWLLRRTCG